MKPQIGYIKLSRKFFTSMWNEARAYSSCEAWIDLIQLARFEATPVKRSIGGREVSYGRGQCVASIRYLAKKWNRGERWVRIVLSKFEKDGRILIDSSQGVNIITLVNYDEYNPCDTTHDTQNDTDKDVKIKELERLVTQLRTQVTTQGLNLGHTDDTNIRKIKKEYKETTTNVVAKKVQLSLNLSEREEIFKSELCQYEPIYGKSMIDEFFLYWTEPNKSRTKMRFEQEKTWDLSRRLARWSKNANPKKTDISEYNIPWDNAMRKFNSLGIINMSSFDDDRKHMFIEIMNTFGTDAITEVYKKIKVSNKLKGQNKDGWKADFDWVFTPKNFRKIREGVYDDNVKQLGIYE